MIKFAHIGDIHIDQVDKHNSLQEQAESLKELGEDALRNKSQFFTIAGDIFDKKSDIQERNTAIEVFQEWANLAPVVVVRGNHDRPNDLSFLGKLKTVFPLIVCETPQTIQIEGCSIHCLPWPNKAQIVQILGLDNQEDVHNAAEAALKGILEGFKVHKAQNSVTPSIMLGHIELGGSRMDCGQPVCPQADFVLNKHDLLDIGLDYYALGHAHLHQVIEEKLCYPGSTRQNTFGENGPKGYCLVSVETGQKPEIEFRHIRHRVLHNIELRWQDSKLVLNGAMIPPKPEDHAKLTYTVADSERESAYLEAKRFGDSLGCEVVIDPKVTQTHRVRSEQIQKTKTTEDKIRAWWETTQTPPRQHEILAKLNILESEVVL